MSEAFGELFESPFNLIGESWSADLTAEGEARVRALAEAEARKAQHLLDLDTLDKAPCDLPLNDAEQAALDREWQRSMFEPAAQPYPNHRRCVNCETLVHKSNVAKHDCARRFDRPYR